MVLIKLFLSFCQIGTFSFGGGYASMRLIQNQVVDIHHWLSMTEFTDIVTISQMTPGPVAINASTFVGMKIAGVIGAIVATLGSVFPSIFIDLIFAYFYYKYRQLNGVQRVLQTLRPAIVAMIGAAGLSILMFALFGTQSVLPDWKNTDLIAAALFIGALFVLRKWKLNPVWVMVGCGVIGMFCYQLH